jgi:aryl-alcohol dehydrogenase-like predicted oxidoreductase
MSLPRLEKLKNLLCRSRDVISSLGNQRVDVGHLLTAYRDAAMQRESIPGIAKPISRLVLGCDKQSSYRQAAEMFDDFFERGGNAFDTAHIYGDGLQERFLGRWLRDRGWREQIVVIGKGGHTPCSTPEGLTQNLYESLRRLQLDHIDLYLIHRDNLDVPAEEFIDVLNEHAREGRVTAFGASNWTVARMETANQYAKSRGVKGFAASSNQFSLARMLDPIWPGCLSASDPASRAWHERTQIPLLAWSSQSRGFFTDRVQPGNCRSEEFARSWSSPENFARRARAIALAKRRGVRPTGIALAYVLAQHFPTLALIGPRTIEQSRATLKDVGVTLTSEEIRWLENGENQ